MGVAVGDLLFHSTGYTGALQITLIVLVALILGSLLTKSVLVSNQIVIGSILIATILPPDVSNAGFDRAIDALIGCIIGIVTIALLPSSPLTNGRNEISKVLAIISSVLDDVVEGLRNKDHAVIDQAMEPSKAPKPKLTPCCGRQVRQGSHQRLSSDVELAPATALL